MATRNCPGCGEEISGTGPACAHCGAPIAGGVQTPAPGPKKKSSKLKIIILVFLGLAVLAALLDTGDKRGKGFDPAAADSAQDTVTAPDTVLYDSKPEPAQEKK